MLPVHSTTQEALDFVDVPVVGIKSEVYAFVTYPFIQTVRKKRTLLTN